MPQSEKDQYQAYFKTLEAESASLPSAMRSIMRRQTEGTLAALRVYKVCGAQPLRDAVRAAVGEAALNAAAVSVEIEHASPSQAKTFAEGVSAMNKIAEVSDRLYKSVIAAGKETELKLLAVQHTAQWSNLLPAPNKAN